MTPRQLYALFSIAWALLWLLSLLSLAGVFGIPVLAIFVYLGMALIPPILLYLLVFRLGPILYRRFQARKQ